MAELKVWDAVILGFVEGLTEFLPISSTGHLIAVTDLLDLDSNQPLLDARGQPLWHRESSGDRQGKMLTPNLATQAYIVVIQFGAIAAVTPFCWAQFMAMLRGLLGRDRNGLRLLVNVVMAFLPAAFFGLLAHDWIDEHLYSVDAVIIALIGGSLLMFYAERRRRRYEAEGIDVAISDLSPATSAKIGLMQCLAMWPGTSRPMMTIVGGYFAGLRPIPAAAFSFLVGFVTLSAASAYKTYKSGALIIQIFGWQNVLLGTAVAAITSAISVRFFISLLLRHGLSAFAWYRIALAIILIFLFHFRE